MEFKKGIQFKEVQQVVGEWVENTEFDLTQDFITEEDKNKMSLQLQQLLSIKGNLESIKRIDGQIFSSAIVK